MLEDSLTALTISSNINNLFPAGRAEEGHRTNIFSNHDHKLLVHCSSYQQLSYQDTEEYMKMKILNPHRSLQSQILRYKAHPLSKLATGGSGFLIFKSSDNILFFCRFIIIRAFTQSGLGPTNMLHVYTRTRIISF